jgi:predicted acyltransferase
VASIVVRAQRVNTPYPARLRSLDAFRGIAVAGMILVNNPGSWTDVYGVLRHADWNGCTVADLVFPFFLFAVGTAITLSLAQRRSPSVARWRLIGPILRRTGFLFALGLFLNGFPLFDWSTLRLPGVLQRIALCYCMGSFAGLVLSARGQAVLAGVLLVGYAVVTWLVHVPANAGSVSEPEATLAAYIDRWLMSGHLLQPGWDPEGLLSTVGATATTLLGMLAGRWLRSENRPSRIAMGSFLAGNAGILLGLLLNRWLPINKSLWTSSYVLFTAGIALDLLTLCYWMIDCRAHASWASPLIAYGTNPIVAYVLSVLLAKTLLLWVVIQPDGARIPFQQYLFEHVFLRLAHPLNASLLYAATYTALWWGITSVLYRHRVLIKI